MKKLLLILSIIAVLALLTTCKNTAKHSIGMDEDYEARREWLLNLYRGHTIRSHPKQGSPEVPVKLYLTDGKDQEALEYITTVFDKIKTNKEKGNVRNATPALVRTLYMFGEHFSDNQIQRIKDAVTSEVVSGMINSHGTENHAAQFVTSMYLLAQYFPDAIWNIREGEQYTSQQMMDTARNHILSRGRGFYRMGNGEQLSTTYDIINSYPFLNLMEFARDPVMREAGEAMVLYHISMLALNNFDGHIMPPFNRRNALQVRFGSPEHTTARYMPILFQAAWLWWGQNEVIPEDFLTAVDPQYTLDYSLAKWRIPESLNRIARGAGTPYEIRGAVGRFGGLWGDAKDLETLRYVWKDRDFAIGGAVAQSFDPDGFFTDYHMFGITWKSSNRLRSLEVMNPYWYSNLGEDYWHTTHSPFQQAGLNHNTAIVMFNIPVKDPWAVRGRKDWLANRDMHFDKLIRLAQVRFPTTVDELVQDGDLYFFREGNVYVAVRVLKPGHTLHKIVTEDEWVMKQADSSFTFYVIKSREAQTGFVFEVGTANDHGNFKAFQEKVRCNPLTVDWDKLEVLYHNSGGEEIRFRYDTDMSEDKNGFILFDPDMWINGEKRDIANWPVADSPVVSLRNGVLRADQGGDSFLVDWSGELPRIARH